RLHSKVEIERMKRTIIATLAAALFSLAAGAQTSDVSPETVSQVQTSLSALGFSPGPADGRLTRQTSEALRQLQRSHNLAPTGTINDATLSALGIRSGAATNTIIAPGTNTVPNATVTVTPNIPTPTTQAFTPSTAAPTPPPSAGMPGTGVPGTAPPG